jgi:hypothetical protein
MVGRLRWSSTQLTLAAFVTGNNLVQGKEAYCRAVARLREYSGALLWKIQEFQGIGDILGAQIIQRSCVGCLAHLAMLCDLTGRLAPNSKPQMDAFCDSSLERLGNVTQGVNFEEYTYLDLLLKVRRQMDYS